MLLGNPDGATPAPQNRQHYLLKRSQYALSYNDTLHYPNWAAWHLNASDIGSTSRGQFQPDPELPRGFTAITPRDYTGSGYDRGHNCPSADRSLSRSANDAVFYMSNMTPQVHGMNAGPWERLESYCRDLTKQGNELYILCGHGFSSPTYRKIGRAQIAVPDFGWKIVVVLTDRAGDDLKRITAQTRVIAVRMPNINTVSKENWTRYLVTPAEIEKATGLNFFASLPATIASALKQKRDSGAGGSRGNSLTRKDAGKKRDSQKAVNIGRVWVNTRSGVYWRSGTEFYGKTRQGQYMMERAAIKAGYRAAKGQ